MLDPAPNPGSVLKVGRRDRIGTPPVYRFAALSLAAVLAIAACSGDDGGAGPTASEGGGGTDPVADAGEGSEATDSTAETGADPAFGTNATWATVGGGTLESSDLDGKEVVAWFWAPW